MRKLTYILSDFQTVNPEEVFNKDRQVLGNILGVPFADEAIVTTSKNERGYTLTITCNHLDTTIYDSAVSVKLEYRSSSSLLTFSPCLQVLL